MANISKLRLSGVTYTIVDETAIHDLSNYYTTAQTDSQITAATSALAQTIAEQGYQTSGDVQNAISSKADTSTVTAVNDTLTAHTANTDIHVTTADKTAWNAKADISDIPSVSGYADAVAYDSNSKEMKFYHGGTSGTEVYSFDASPFLIDGMVDNVEIKDVTISGESVTCLVITFNTDAGKQEIDIPISEIFDSSNYWTTAQTENAIAAAISGKADTSAVTESINAATSGKVDTSTFETYSGSVDTALSEKQDVLVSGASIKTINNESLLGSGNITIEAAGTVDQTIISGSTNAVAGGAVYTALAGKNGVVTLDNETLVIS